MHVFIVSPECETSHPPLLDGSNNIWPGLNCEAPHCVILSGFVLLPPFYV